MAILNRNIYIQATPGGVPDVLHIPQGDSAERTYTFFAVSGDTVLTFPAGSSAWLEGKTAAGQNFNVAGSLNAARNGIIIPADTDYTGAAGVFLARLGINTGSGIFHTARIQISIDPNPGS